MAVSPRSRLTRETQLLLIVISLSAVVLIVLSRFRFPDRPASAPTGATRLPLERLAARATYDELATIIADLGTRVTPSVVVLRVDLGGTPRFVPALRVRPDLLLAHLPAESRVLGLIGLDAPVDVAAYDETRQLLLLRVPPEPSRVMALGRTDPGAATPRYVGAVEGTPGGPAVRPLFLGRTDPVPDERYDQGLLVLGGVLQASSGSLIFGLDGTFVGLCIMDEGFAAGVPGRALDAAIDRMLQVR